jgi:hypothetical protein
VDRDIVRSFRHLRSGKSRPCGHRHVARSRASRHHAGLFGSHTRTEGTGPAKTSSLLGTQLLSSTRSVAELSRELGASAKLYRVIEGRQARSSAIYSQIAESCHITRHSPVGQIVPQDVRRYPLGPQRWKARAGCAHVLGQQELNTIGAEPATVHGQTMPNRSSPDQSEFQRNPVLPPTYC